MLKHCSFIIHIENLLVSRLRSLFALFYIVIFYETPLQGCHFPRKNYSAEHGTDGTFDSFRRNSACLKNARNSVPSHSAEFRSIPGKIKSSECRSEPFRRREKHSKLSNFVPSHSAEFFSTESRSVPCRTSEWAVPRHMELRERNTFFHGITKIVPSLYRRIFSERNFDGHPTPLTCQVFRSYFDVFC